MIRINNRAFIANWSQLNRWDTNSLFTVEWIWPEETLKPLSEAVIRQIEPVETKQGTRELPIIQKISFGGRLTIREEEQRHNYKGKLFWAYPGNLVYSKIRVKQGSVAIVPQDLSQVAVSNEYPVYRIRPEVALPAYLTLVLRSSAFKQLLDGLSNGGSSKTRVAANTLENLIVPLPSLPVQAAIVEAYETGVAEAARLRHEAKELEAQIKGLFAGSYGLSTQTIKAAPKCFTLKWSELERWSLNYLGRTHFTESVQAGNYQTAPLGELTQGRSGGTPSKRIPAYWHGTTPWVSPKDMKVYELHDAEDHISEIAFEESAASLLPINSILLVVRSGILQRLVPIAINRVPVTINQDIRAFTVTDERLLPEFLGAYLRAAQTELLRLVKTGVTVESINKEELENFPVPLPPLEVQIQLLEQDKDLRQQISNLRTLAAETEAAAVARVEALILGHAVE